jgi:hypothetical protein
MLAAVGHDEPGYQWQNIKATFAALSIEVVPSSRRASGNDEVPQSDEVR